MRVHGVSSGSAKGVPAGGRRAGRIPAGGGPAGSRPAGVLAVVVLAGWGLAGCGSGSSTSASTPSRTSVVTNQVGPTHPVTAVPASPQPATSVAATPAPASSAPAAPTSANSTSAAPPLVIAGSPSAAPAPAVETTLRSGDSGPAVLAMQRQLIALGYWIPRADGRYGLLTQDAVVALQKAANLHRDGVVGPKTRVALARGIVPLVRSSQGHVIEVDLTHQLLKVVDDGRLTLVLDTSTASGHTYVQPRSGHTVRAVTPTGIFHVQRQIDGWRTSDLGHLWRPKYFTGGIAVHGYPSVPAYPASHGCVRVPMQAMNLLWDHDLMPIGTTVWVYTSSRR